VVLAFYLHDPKGCAMKTLTFELHDDIYEALQRMAEQTGRPFEAVALEWLAKYAYPPRPKRRLSEEELAAAEERLRRHAGAVDSGDPHSADNERIDADLAREYGSTHEEEA
jgi:predicted transcriptional regulator